MPVSGGGFEQYYNAQAVVAEGSLLVVAGDVALGAQRQATAQTDAAQDQRPARRVGQGRYSGSHRIYSMEMSRRIRVSPLQKWAHRQIWHRQIYVPSEFRPFRSRRFGERTPNRIRSDGVGGLPPARSSRRPDRCVRSSPSSVPIQSLHRSEAIIRLEPGLQDDIAFSGAAISLERSAFRSGRVHPLLLRVPSVRLRRSSPPREVDRRHDRRVATANRRLRAAAPARSPSALHRCRRLLGPQ